ILNRAIKLKTFLKSADRVEKVAAFVARHFRENVEPLGYKAFVVGVDREACALYKEALDKLLPAYYSQAIYTAAQHDSERYPLVYRYQQSAEEEKKARKLFPKPDTLPKIFIVTDKLLTGFDAPVLYCMYLDKPMRDHVLLQAIARVNRPYEEDGAIKKPCGLVVDFVGIFEKLEKALAFDSDVISGVINNIDLLLARFIELMTGQARPYIELTHGQVDDKMVERAIDAFIDKDRREEFYKFFKELETLYEILSPSAALRDYLEDFGLLSVLYQILRNAFKKKTGFYGDIAKKTEMLVREKVTAYGLTTTTPAVRIDEATLAAMKAADSSTNTKVINLINGVIKTVGEEGDENPYLKPIGERAEAIREAFDNRQVTALDALKRIEAIINEILEARRQQEKTGFDMNTFTIYWLLKQENVRWCENLAPVINNVFLRFPNFRENIAELRQLKAELYKVLLPVVGKDAMVGIVDKLLRLDRR
ncbi:MAG TPA: hypothetical protein P5244_06955, partial [Syntrophales bacterium]|nr:hypothetical protein [Syntrophales bacterium]